MAPREAKINKVQILYRYKSKVPRKIWRRHTEEIFLKTNKFKIFIKIGKFVFEALSRSDISWFDWEGEIL